MINKRNSTIVAAIAGVMLLLMGAVPALADTATSTAAATPRVNFLTNLIHAIAQKFGLQESDVQSVVDAQKAQAQTQMAADMQARLKTRLDQAVTAGKLTQAQESAIITEEASVQSQMDALKTSGKTGNDLKLAMDQIRTSVDQWAQANSIPAQYVMLAQGMGGPSFGRGMKNGAWMGKTKAN